MDFDLFLKVTNLIIISLNFIINSTGSYSGFYYEILGKYK